MASLLMEKDTADEADNPLGLLCLVIMATWRRHYFKDKALSCNLIFGCLVLLVNLFSEFPFEGLGCDELLTQ